MRKTVKVDLGEGFEDEWVELVDPRFLSQRQFGALSERSKDDPKAWLRECISAWHITNDEGTALSDPKTDDIDSIPSGVVKAVVEKLSELFNAAIPKT